METEIRESIVELLNYLADEESHFEENCECEEPTSDIEICSCEANENHIWREREKVRVWLENGN